MNILNRLYDLLFIKSKSSDDKKDNSPHFVEIIQEHDDELAAEFGDFNNRLDKYNKNINSRLSNNSKAMNIKETQIFQALKKWM
jgi:hypothetical protein